MTTRSPSCDPVHSDVATDAGTTFVDVLGRAAMRPPDQRGWTFLEDGEDKATHWTFRDVDRRARAIAVALGATCPAGSRALLLYPPGLDFIAGFFGCLYAGVIAVPAYPPDPSNLARSVPRVRAIAEDAAPAVVLSNTFGANLRGFLAASAPELTRLPWLATDTIDLATADTWRRPAIDGRSIAFLQYTSGSTGTPRGVVVTHANLTHNSAEIHRLAAFDDDTVYVCWVPTYHDMGLIGGVLQAAFGQFRAVLMSPLHFLQRPSRWLRAVSRHRGTVTPFPNFALDLVTRKTTDAELAQLDLSSWSIACNGAEPIAPGSLERFTARFAAAGFDARAHYPCYGLAEGTLIVSGRLHGGRRDARFLSVDGSRLRAGAVEPLDARAGVRLVSCGAPLESQDLRIVDPETHRECSGDRVGEIWLRGPSVAAGYWGRTEETQATFGAMLASGEGPFLRTGDLGFLHAGELYITGRLKDLVIIRGENHYPQDLERTAEQAIAGLRPGCSVAFATTAGETEGLVLVHEVDRGTNTPPADLCRAVRSAISQNHGIEPEVVVLAKAGAVAKTSSGKLQRRATRELYQMGKLDILYEDRRARGSERPQIDLGAIAVLPQDARARAIAAHLGARLAFAVGLDVAAIADTAPITSLGLDSLRLVQLFGHIEEDLGVRIELSQLASGTTTAQLAARLAERLLESAPAARALLARIDGLPDHEVARLLTELRQRTAVKA